MPFPSSLPDGHGSVQGEEAYPRRSRSGSLSRLLPLSREGYAIVGPRDPTRSGGPKEVFPEEGGLPWGNQSVGLRGGRSEPFRREGGVPRNRGGIRVRKDYPGQMCYGIGETDRREDPVPRSRHRRTEG